MLITTVMISTTIFQNNIEKLEKIINFVFIIFWVLFCFLPGIKKLQQIISKHKQEFIPMAI